MRRVALSLILLVACAARPPALPPSLGFAQIQAMTRSSCPYASAVGPSLVCVVKDGDLYTAVIFDAGAGTRVEKELISIETDKEALSPVVYEGGNLEAVNQELRARPYTTSKVVYRGQDGPRGALARGFSVELGDKELQLKRGETVLETLRWDDLRTVVSATVEVIDLGGPFAAVAVLQGEPRLPIQATVLEIWTGAGHECPSRVRCPPHHELVRHYLGTICSDTFDELFLVHSVLEHVEADLASGALTKDDLVILANAHDALTGKRFSDAGLQAFFYDKEARSWLPAACLGFFPSREFLTISHLAGQEALQKLLAK
jgi:hypothetical protein